MTDTPETLKAALAELAARVAAFEKARAEEEEPPKLLNGEMDGVESLGNGWYKCAKAIRRLRYCERELARLREGLKRQSNDYPDEVIREEAMWGSPYAREIKRHRALLKDGGGK